jgi:hypothetical protein
MVILKKSPKVGIVGGWIYVHFCLSNNDEVLKIDLLKWLKAM